MGDNSQHSHENFSRTLTEQCQTHEEWLAVVRFGLQELLREQSLLVELLFAEATREAERGNHQRQTDEELDCILQELGLRFVIDPGTSITDKPVFFAMDDARRLQDVVRSALAAMNDHTGKLVEPDEVLDRDMRLLTELQEVDALLAGVLGSKSDTART